ncbi:MAG: hypothetical protein Q3962_02840 [Corynebacterium sp.]|nr:hypothetical protein [Corynebacterium sp.]
MANIWAEVVKAQIYGGSVYAGLITVFLATEYTLGNNLHALFDGLVDMLGHGFPGFGGYPYVVAFDPLIGFDIKTASGRNHAEFDDGSFLLAYEAEAGVRTDLANHSEHIACHNHSSI